MTAQIGVDPANIVERLDSQHPHFVCTRSRSKILTRQVAQGLRNSGKNIPPFECLHKKRTNRKTNGKKLDTNLFESYLEDLWSMIPEEQRRSSTYIDCLWFRLYRDGLSKDKVLQWIKEKEIFSRKYVFVPIICWKHWSVLILCHLGVRRPSKKKKPFMLLLDSLHQTDPKRLEPDIRRFVLDIYRSEGRKEKENTISDIPLLIPKVPQQINGEECGLFALYFIYRFLQNTPEDFNLQDFPYFLTEDWFTLKELEGFQTEIHSTRMSKDIIEVE